jgi:chromosome segregation ATPase
MGVAKFEDFKAPWEVDASGAEIPEDEQKLDGSKLKKHLHNLLSDKERLQTTVQTLTTERDDYKGKVEAEVRKGETEAEKTKRENDELKTKLAEATKGSVESLKLEVALDKGLTKVQAKRLLGSTREELEADADDLVASFGSKGKNDDADDAPRRTPKRLHANSREKEDTGSDLVYSREKLNEIVPF